MGCEPPPVPKEKHVQQIQQVIATVGVTNIINESRTILTRLSHETDDSGYYMLTPGDRRFAGLSGLTNLGSPFHYSTLEPDRIRIRIYNSHRDVYSIALLNPDMPEPAGFERIAGNVGFIEPGGPPNGSEPVRSETNRTSSAAGTRR